jgi:hypothetical protein
VEKSDADACLAFVRSGVAVCTSVSLSLPAGTGPQRVPDRSTHPMLLHRPRAL